jgi:serine/threonine protein kinase
MTSPLAPDQIVAQRYQLLERLDAFGAGEVWKARDVKFRTRTVALKFLRALASDANELPDDLSALLAAARELRHRAVLPIVNHGLVGRRPFVAYEFFAGVSLGARLDASRRAGAPLALDWIRAVFESVCDALSAAHECSPPVVHGSLGAAQVIVGDDGSVRVIDFGLGSLLDVSPASGRDAHAAACLAPEQYAGHAPRPPADVFALGLLLMDMLAAPPDVRASAPAAWRYIGRTDLADKVWDVILGATRKDPEDRYASPAAFVAALASAWEVPAPGADPAPAEVTPDAPPLLGSTLVDRPPEEPSPRVLAATEVLPPEVTSPARSVATTALWTSESGPSARPSDVGGETLRAKVSPSARKALARTVSLADEAATSAATSDPTDGRGDPAKTALFSPRHAAQMTSLSAVVSDLDRLVAARAPLEAPPPPREVAKTAAPRAGRSVAVSPPALWVGVGLALLAAVIAVCLREGGLP